VSRISHFHPYEELAASLLANQPGNEDGSHDLSHTIRVWRNASRIRESEGGDGRILAAAVLLHDSVAVEKSSPLRSQASRLAAEQARTVLRDLGWSEADTEAAAHAIEAHSFSANLQPRTLEARILQDADRLDAIGCIGIARCFYTAGRMNSRLYESEDPDAQARPLDDRQFALDHFPAKLLHLHANFQTAAGAQMAAERHARLQRFYEEFLLEL
jgi:uncharacterized protein